MPKRSSARRYNVSKLPDYTSLKSEQAKAALDKLLELKNFSVGKRGTQNWLNAVRSTGVLLTLLTEEEYYLVCLAFKKQLDSPKPPVVSLPVELPDQTPF